MSTFNRLFDLAAKALDKTGSPPATSSPAPAGGQAPKDWRAMVRTAADALTGDAQSRTTPTPTPSAPGAGQSRTTPVSMTPPPPGAGRASGTDADRAAIARYDYLMKTADPYQIERIHQEAFARLTPPQRAEVEARMRAELPAYDQPKSAGVTDLARAAARSEAQHPGRMRGLLARAGGRTALAGAGVAAGGILGVVAGGAVLSTVATPILEQATDFGVDFDAIAQGIDVGALAEGAEGMLGSATEQVSGLGEHAAEAGGLLSDLGLPDLGQFFTR